MNSSQRIAACAIALALAPAAWSAGSRASSEAERTYQKERAHCMSGRSNQDRATCLKEAGAARAEARRNNLGTRGDGSLSGNAVDRCRSQPAADRQDCIQRIQGAGNTQGSVEAGGLIRSVETPVK